MEKKTLLVNCAVCDARRVTQATLESYESVAINAAIVLATPESRELLHRYAVTLNAASVRDLPGEVRVVTHNGSFTIAAGDEPSAPTVLIMNGSLTVEPGAEAALRGYLSIQVNGRISYPRSLAPAMTMLQVNGAADVYPDGAVLLRRSFVVDRVFLLRARQAQYYAPRRVVLTDCGLDVPALVEKGVRFLTKEAVLAEPLLEAALPLFGEDTEITAVPEGCAFINDDATLDEALLRRHGTLLYINGDLRLPAGAGPLLERLRYLYVNGDVLLPRALEAAFAALDAHYGELRFVRAHSVCDRPLLRVTRELLARGDGLSVSDCAVVTLAKDVTPEEIETRLDVSDCAVVRCAPAQRDALEQVCRDVAQIAAGDESGGLSALLGQGKDKKVVNAASYTL